jgi:hypothetical protein
MTNSRRRAWELEGHMETVLKAQRLEIPVAKMLALLDRVNHHPGAWVEIQNAYEAVGGDPDELHGRVFGDMLLITRGPLQTAPF